MATRSVVIFCLITLLGQPARTLTKPGDPGFIELHPKPNSPECQQLRKARCEISEKELKTAQAYSQSPHRKCVNDLVFSIHSRLLLDGVRPGQKKNAPAPNNKECASMYNATMQLSRDLSAILTKVRADQEKKMVERLYNLKNVAELEDTFLRCNVEQERFQFETALLSRDAYGIQANRDTPDRLLTRELACIYKAPVPDNIIVDQNTGLNAMKVEEIEACPGKKTREVIVFKGSQGAKDWVGNLTLGKSKTSDLVFIEKWAEAALKEKHDLTFAGHSLGGALAQAFSYMIEKDIRMDVEKVPISTKAVDNATKTIETLKPQVDLLVARAMEVAGEPFSAWSPTESIVVSSQRSANSMTIRHEGRTISVLITPSERETLLEYLGAKSEILDHLEVEKNLGGISVVTWNSFGGQELVAYAYGESLPAMVRTANGINVENNTIDQNHPSNRWMSSVQNTTNYYVGSDFVKEVGTHIGITRELPIPSPENPRVAHNLADFIIPELDKKRGDFPLLRATVQRTPETATSKKSGLGYYLTAASSKVYNAGQTISKLKGDVVQGVIQLFQE